MDVGEKKRFSWGVFYILCEKKIFIFLHKKWCQYFFRHTLAVYNLWSTNTNFFFAEKFLCKKKIVCAFIEIRQLSMQITFISIIFSLSISRPSFSYLLIFWQLHIKIQQDLQGLVGGVTGLFGSAKPKESTYSAPTYSTKPSTPKLKIPKLPTLKLPETPYGKPPVSIVYTVYLFL